MQGPPTAQSPARPKAGAGRGSRRDQRALRAIPRSLDLIWRVWGQRVTEPPQCLPESEVGVGAGEQEVLSFNSRVSLHMPCSTLKHQSPRTRPPQACRAKNCVALTAVLAFLAQGPGTQPGQQHREGNLGETCGNKVSSSVLCAHWAPAQKDDPRDTHRTSAP